MQTAKTSSPLPLSQKEYWQGVSEEAKAFVRRCLTIDPTNRPTAKELLEDAWLKDVEDYSVQTPRGSATDLLPQVRKAFDARKTCTSRRLRPLTHSEAYGL